MGEKQSLDVRKTVATASAVGAALFFGFAIEMK